MSAIHAVAGSMLCCSCGNQLSALRPSGRVATVRDFVPLVNLGAFGRCAGAANPLRQDDALPPCVPVVSQPWEPGHASLRADGVPILPGDAITRCCWGGIIRIVIVAREERDG